MIRVPRSGLVWSGLVWSQGLKVSRSQGLKVDSTDSINQNALIQIAGRNINRHNAPYHYHQSLPSCLSSSSPPLTMDDDNLCVEVTAPGVRRKPHSGSLIRWVHKYILPDIEYQMQNILKKKYYEVHSSDGYINTYIEGQMQNILIHPMGTEIHTA